MNFPKKFPFFDRKVCFSFVTTFVALGGIFFVVSFSRLGLAQSGELPPMSVQGEAGSQQNANLSDSLQPLAPGNWLAASTYPTTISNYGFAQVGQDLYVISGVSNGSIVNTVRRYNATTNVWTALASIPVGSRAPAAAYFDGRIYVAEGGGGGNLIRIYNIATNSWSAGPARPGVSSSIGAAAGAFEGKVYVVGGGFLSNTAVSIYDIANNSWSAGPAAPSPYLSGGYVQVGQFLYLIGSRTTDSATNSSVSKRLDMAAIPKTWSTGPAWTPQRADFALAAAGSKLYAIGGDANGGDSFNASAQVDELDTAAWPAGLWIASPDNLPSVRLGNQAGFLSGARGGGEIWSTGGLSTSVVYLNEHLYRAVNCLNYAVAQSTGALVPGTTDTGNHCDDCITTIALLPFPVAFYGTTFTSANLSSNGNLQFISNSTAFNNAALPNAAFNMAIFPFWDDLRTNEAGKGIFTTVQGAAPNRVFNIEWRVVSLDGANSTNFELRLFEGSPVFDILYGVTSGAFTGTIGLQRDTGSLFTQAGATNTNVPGPARRRTFAPGCCPPITFNGAIGSNSTQYPGSSGIETNRVVRQNPASVCGSVKSFPGSALGSYSFDQYSFTNDGPATCVTFSVYTACTGSQFIFPVAYLGSFNPANIAANYLGDSGVGSPDPYRSFSVDVPANATVVLVLSETQAGSGCPGYTVTATGLKCPPLQLVSAESRKTHGGNPFEIHLPPFGTPGVECRTGGAGGNHTLVFTFNTALVSGSASVTAGVGTAGAATFASNKMTVPLTGVSDVQKITVTLNGVTDTFSRVLPSTPISMNVLLGDTTGSKAVNASDIAQTKSKSGQTVSAANFRNDTTVSGSINASDIGQVKANSGHSVP